jgi:hypothetical protein
VLGGKEHTKLLLFWGRKANLGFYVPKILVMGQSNVSFWEGKKKVVGILLIN